MFCSDCEIAYNGFDCTSIIQIGETNLAIGTTVFVYIKNKTTDSIYRFTTSVNSDNLIVIFPETTFMGDHSYEVWATVVNSNLRLTLTDEQGTEFTCASFKINPIYNDDVVTSYLTNFKIQII
jgi:hypothetical protein